MNVMQSHLIIPQILNKVSRLISLNSVKPWMILKVRNYASYLSSSQYNPKEKIDFEVSRNLEEWKYVERLFPFKHVPQPVQKEIYPSGWKPQNPEARKGPYYVRRSCNHMLPVYLSTSHRGLRKVTTVRHIQGDIWLFAEELKTYLERKTGKSVGFRVDELGCKISFRGDYVYFTQEFITNKGF